MSSFRTGSVSEPIPISLIAGRYLLFDSNAVAYLRRDHNICGVLLGGLPQVPQQNIFLGLPVELLPEEVKCLVRNGVAYIVDDVAWHKERLTSLKGVDRKRYLDSLKVEGQKARQLAEEMSKRRTEWGRAKQATLRTSKEPVSDARTEAPDSNCSPTSEFETTISSPETFTSALYTVTTTTSSLLPPLENPSVQPDPPVPTSYPLFAHLHAQKYFVTPGLRFGCDYAVYPGDPLRFHSHFLAVGYDWDTEIPLIDIVGGGRLGTGVKKGFLIGGKNPAQVSEDRDPVRTFCIEWGGM